MAGIPRVLAVILARGGSSRMPGKNLAPLGSDTLVRHAAKAALAARTVTRVVVSTDSEEISQSAGVDWIKRPPEISTNRSTIEEACAHALVTVESQERENNPRPEYDYVVALQAAAPIRPDGAIDALVSAVIEAKAPGGVTAVRRSPWMWRVYPGPEGTATSNTWWAPSLYPRSQDVPHITLEEINCIQVSSRATTLKHLRHGSPMVLLEIPDWCAYDVDTFEDYDRMVSAWPMVEKLLASHDGKFQAHVSRHDWRPPSSRFPLLTPWGPGLSGIVIGNAPTIDAIPRETWQALDSQWLVTVGLNRVCCSVACSRHNFAPTIHMIWDRWNDERARKNINAGLARLAGRSWRLCGPDSRHVLEHDQVIGKASDAFGPPMELKMRHGSADGAANLLYRLGCRRIYFLGVEMLSGERCAVPWDEGPGSCGNDAWGLAAMDALRDIAKYPGVSLRCMSPRSRLIDDGLMQYGWPEGVADPFAKEAAQAAS